MINAVPPALIFIVGALFVPLFKGYFRNAYLLCLPLLGLVNLMSLPKGASWVFSFLDFQVGLVHVDKLSFLIGLAFHIVVFLGMIYMLHSKRTIEYMSAFFYVGCALGVVFACDLLTIFVFWECLTLSAVFLILAERSQLSRESAFRYFLMHLLGGLFLLLGLSMHILQVGSTAIETISLNSLSSYLIFIGLGVNAGWPLLHTWIKDAYPEATIGGTVLLSAITTKVAVYVLMRLFPGTDLLIWIGAAMILFPICFSIIENDLRRVLSYSLISQLGFMMVGIGLGTPLAMDGAAAHLFSHIFYKALLFMAIGAVIYRTGTAKASELGGLYKTMPWTCAFCIIGSLSLCAVPFFSGFVTKSLLLNAVLHEHVLWLWAVMVFASAVSVAYVGFKVPFFAFFAKDKGLEVKEVPLSMLIAMGSASALCIGVGLFPRMLYSLLPHTLTYSPYTIAHVLPQIQLLSFAALAVGLLIFMGLYPKMRPSIILDVDLLYRVGFSKLKRASDVVFSSIERGGDAFFVQGLTAKLTKLSTNFPAYIVNSLLTPLWIVGGVEAPVRSRYRSQISKAFVHSTVSVAWPVILTLIIFGLFLVI